MRPCHAAADSNPSLAKTPVSYRSRLTRCDVLRQLGEIEVGRRGRGHVGRRAGGDEREQLPIEIGGRRLVEGQQQIGVRSFERIDDCRLQRRALLGREAGQHLDGGGSLPGGPTRRGSGCRAAADAAARSHQRYRRGASAKKPSPANTHGALVDYWTTGWILLCSRTRYHAWRRATGTRLRAAALCWGGPILQATRGGS